MKIYLVMMRISKMGPKERIYLASRCTEETPAMPVVTVDEAKHLVEKWMQDRKFSTPSQQMPAESLQEVNFSYNGKTETGFGFIVIQPKQATRVIIMASRLDVAKSHADALGSMKARKLEDLLWELKKELVLSTASYMIMPPTGIPKSIQFSREISFDELTEGKLADALGSITKSMVLTILLFSKRFGQGN